MTGSDRTDGDDFALRWPGPVRGRHESEPVETHLDWDAHTAGPRAAELPPAEPPSAGPAPASPARHDARGFRIRLRSTPASGGPPGDRHQECRDEIERLEDLVAELRGELTQLRRKAQLRSPR